jgi:SAM-dependent methyltransferase
MRHQQLVFTVFVTFVTRNVTEMMILSNRIPVCVFGFLVLLLWNKYLEAVSTSWKRQTNAAFPFSGFHSRPITVREQSTPIFLKNEGDHDGTWSRRDFFWIAPAAVGYTKLSFDILQREKLLIYPPDHENRVRLTIQHSLLSAATSKQRHQQGGNEQSQILRVLEVGIGASCRLIQRGLYEPALFDLAARGIRNVSITGIDIKAPNPSVVAAINRNFSQSSDQPSVSLQTISASITEPLPFPASYFDSVICCLTLCSVDDPEAAVEEIRRVLRPDGGTFGYIEHVAVNTDEPYHLLATQQQVLDPLQRVLAGNCHLHRDTQSIIRMVFGSSATSISDTQGRQIEGSVELSQERFIVDAMWPVSCQCRGIIQRQMYSDA